MKKNTKKDQNAYINKAMDLLRSLGAKYIEEIIESDNDMGFIVFSLETKAGNLKVMIPTKANIYTYHLFTQFENIASLNELRPLPLGISKNDGRWDFNNHNMGILLYLVANELQSVIKPEETINNITKEELLNIMTETPFIRGIDLETYRKEFEEAASIIFDRISGKLPNPIKLPIL